jgi:RNA recognition motif-containing protein
MQLTAEQLRPVFEAFGTIEDVMIIYDKTTHLSKGAFCTRPAQGHIS